jgi:hypothetical protein
MWRIFLMFTPSSKRALEPAQGVSSYMCSCLYRILLLKCLRINTLCFVKDDKTPIRQPVSELPEYTVLDDTSTTEAIERISFISFSYFRVMDGYCAFSFAYL